MLLSARYWGFVLVASIAPVIFLTSYTDAGQQHFQKVVSKGSLVKAWATDTVQTHLEKVGVSEYFGVTPWPDYAIDGVNDESVTLVTPAPESGYDILEVKGSDPFRLLHFSTSIHPRKAYNSTGYLLTSLWFMEDKTSYRPPYVQGQNSPHLGNLSFVYRFGDEPAQPAKIVKQGRNEFFLVECDLPSWATALTEGSPKEARRKALKRIVDSDTSLEINIRIEGNQTEELDRWYIPRWTSPTRKDFLGACVAPLYFQGQEKMTDILEWRIHHKLQGMGVVHWYTRNRAFEAWVAALNAYLGTHDTVQHAPFVSETAGRKKWWYTDQSIWYQDCLNRHHFATEWAAVIDTDEYMMQAGEMRQNGVASYLRDPQLDKFASLYTYHVYWGGKRIQDAPHLPGFTDFPRNAQDRWTYRYKKGGWNRIVKAIHRTAGVETLWVHGSLALANGWKWDREEPKPDNRALVLHHSRKPAYHDIDFNLDYNPGPGDRELWDHAARLLKGTRHLHSLDLK